MDPLACLMNAADCATSGNGDESEGYLADYREWRAKGGYQPLVACGERAVPGDLFAVLVMRKLERMNG